jgi:hypothetical protein
MSSVELFKSDFIGWVWDRHENINGLVRLAKKSLLKVLFADLLWEKKYCSLAEKIRLIRQANRAVSFSYLPLPQLPWEAIFIKLFSKTVSPYLVKQRCTKWGLTNTYSSTIMLQRQIIRQKHFIVVYKWVTVRSHTNTVQTWMKK